MSEDKAQILIVEDEPGMALLLNRLLENLGYKVPKTVARGEDAVEYVKENKPDLILMDIYLEGEMNGIQAAEIILNREHIPVIYATSDADEQTIQTAKSTFPLGYILKPYNKNVLKSTIEVALSIKLVEDRKNEELQKAYETISYQTGELLESFKSAKEIQRAILPSEKDFRNLFTESFIVNLPKESLGGDFFWYKRLTENEVLFGVIDCTGHGVPGALMSILVNYQFSKGLGVLPKGSDLGDLLTYIDKNLSDVYWEDNNLGFSADETDKIKNLNAGFDAGVCLYNDHSGELTFCGAKRPLWIIRNNEVIEMKGNRASVGLYSLANKAFNTERFKIEKGDRLFIFSDGFADQIGGPKLKRYKSNLFREFLLATSRLKISEQRSRLIEEFKSWQGDYEQMDDVIVLGIQF